MTSSPPPAGFGAPGVRIHPFPPRPVHPIQPVRFPVFVPVFVGPIFPGFGFGFGFNSLWWSGCNSFLYWNFACGFQPYYGYGFQNYGPVASPTYEPPPGPAYPAPLYLYGGAERELVQLYMKDGTIYNVLDYWVVDNQLHFTMNEGGETPVEHVVGLDDLDMQKTIDVNTQRGFNFTLRNEPIEQYLEDHPDLGAPQDQTPPAPQAPNPPPQ